MATSRRVRQIHGHLGVFDPPSGTGVLPLHSDGGSTFLHIASLIDHQDRIAITKMCDHIGPQILAHAVNVPLGAREQMLQPVRVRVTAALGQRPAVLAAQIRDQPQHQRTCVAKRLAPDEPRRPRQLQMSSQTPNDAAVTAPNSANTPTGNYYTTV